MFTQLLLFKIWQDLFGIETKKAFLIRAHLVDIDVIIAGIHILLDAIQMFLGIGAADHRFDPEQRPPRRVDRGRRRARLPDDAAGDSVD